VKKIEAMLEPFKQGAVKEAPHDSSVSGSPGRPGGTAASVGRLTEPAAIPDLVGFLSDVETKAPQRNEYGCETSRIC
jgi:hypothetical protein